MEVQFEFVSAGNLGKPKSADRRLIRSRCMQGKNRREGSRRSKQKQRRAAATLTAPHIALPVWDVEIPPPPPSDIKLVRLPGELDLDSEELLYKRE